MGNNRMERGSMTGNVLRLKAALYMIGLEGILHIWRSDLPCLVEGFLVRDQCGLNGSAVLSRAVDEVG